MIAFIATRDLGRAKMFYSGTLGLRFVSEDNFALVLNAHGTMLRVVMVQEHTPAPYTVLGWRVPSTPDAAKNLRKAGVRFDIYNGMQQDPAGIWTSPTGARVAWFKDPDGNVLSISDG